MNENNQRSLDGVLGYALDIYFYMASSRHIIHSVVQISKEVCSYAVYLDGTL
jgi:hypothetical protein